MNFWGERNGKSGGGEIAGVIKRLVLHTIMVAFLLTPTLSITAENRQCLEKCLELLSKGKEDEKQLALDGMWGCLSDPVSEMDKTALGHILKILTDKNPSLREAAAASLKKLGEKGAFRHTEIVPSLIQALNDEVPAVRREAAKALAFYKDKCSVEPLIERLVDKDPWVRLEAVHALQELRDHRALLPLVRLLYDDSDFRYKFVQQESLKALSRIGLSRTQERCNNTIWEIGRLEEDSIRNLITPVLIRKGEDRYLTAEVIRTIGSLRINEGKDLLYKAATDEVAQIRVAALESSRQLFLPDPLWERQHKLGTVEMKAEEPMIALWIASLKDPSAKARALSADALGKTADQRAIGPLIEALRDSDREVRKRVIEALGKFEDERDRKSVV